MAKLFTNCIYPLLGRPGREGIAKFTATGTLVATACLTTPPQGRRPLQPAEDFWIGSARPLYPR
jgi:hypothetical protein